jgi:hypothetical protein
MADDVENGTSGGQKTGSGTGKTGFFKRHRKAVVVGAVCVAVACAAGIGIAYAAYTPATLPLDAEEYPVAEEDDGVTTLSVSVELPDFESVTADDSRSVLVGAYAKFELASDGDSESDTVWMYNVQDAQDVALADGTWNVTWYDAVLKDGSVYSPETATATITVGDGSEEYASDGVELKQTYTLVDATDLAQDKDCVSAIVAALRENKDGIVAASAATSEQVDEAISVLEGLVAGDSTETADGSDASAASEGQVSQSQQSAGDSSGGSSSSGATAGSSSDSSTAGKTKVWVDTTYKTVPVYEEQDIFDEYTWTNWGCNNCYTTYPGGRTGSAAEQAAKQAAANCPCSEEHGISSCTNDCRDYLGTKTVQVGTKQVVDVEGHWEYR